MIAIFRRTAEFIKSDEETLSLFSSYCDPALVSQALFLIQHSSPSNPLSLTIYHRERRQRERQEEQLRKLQEHFLAFMEHHPSLKERFIRMLNARKNDEILVEI